MLQPEEPRQPVEQAVAVAVDEAHEALSQSHHTEAYN